MGMTLPELVDRLRPPYEKQLIPLDEETDFRNGTSLSLPTASEEDTPPLGDEVSEGEAAEKEGNLMVKGSNSVEEEDPTRDEKEGEPIEEECPKKHLNEEEKEPIEEEDPEEDPSEDEEEPMEEDDSTEEEEEFIEEGGLEEEPEGNEDKGVEPAEERSEYKIITFPWRQRKCGRMCREECPLDALASRD